MPETEMLDKIDQVARRFHDLYFGHLHEHGLLVTPPDFDKMNEHAEAMRAALFQMQEEGTVGIAQLG